MRSREAGRARHSCASPFVGLCSSPAPFYRVRRIQRERDRQHEIETEHESGGGSRGTRETQPDYSLVQTRILILSDWIRSSTDVRTGFNPPKSVETKGRGADFIAQVGGLLSSRLCPRGKCSEVIRLRYCRAPCQPTAVPLLFFYL